jgi:cytochrome c oxidase assembly protein subunit 15
LALVIFQGWLGSLVVSTNLMPFMISIHMVLAILLVIMLIYTVYRGGAYSQFNTQIESSGLLKGSIIVLMVLTFIQIMIGVQVREEVDMLMTIGVGRDSIISNLRDSFLFHRSFSILLVIGHVFILYKIYNKHRASFNLKFWCNFIFLLVVLSSVTGIVLNYFSFPAFIQPVHLLFASMLIGGQFIIYLLVHTTNKVVKTV